MVSYFDNLQSSSQVMHEAQIFNIVIANLGPRQSENDIDVYLAITIGSLLLHTYMYTHI